MSNIKQQTLKRAITLLNAINAQYAIIDEDGTLHGDLKVAEVKSEPKYERGERSNWAKEMIGDMSITDVREVPFGKYGKEEARNALSLWAYHYWGKGSVATSLNNTKQVVEVLRVM
jgi:hypothetical protein